MKKELSVYYDQKGDILELRLGKPTEGYMKDLGDDIFQRIDEKTQHVQGFIILNFIKRTKRLKPIEVPLPGMIRIAA